MTAFQTLVVEDDPACAEALGELLNDAGYQTRHAADPGQAMVAMARDAAVGIVVLDFHLLEMDGLRLLRELRAAASERGSSIQVLLCSGAAGMADLDAAMRLGVAAYLPKPIERAALLNAMADAARRYRDLEADRTARSAMIGHFRTLEDGLIQASRQMSQLLDLPAAPSLADPESAPGFGAAPAPGVDRAWQALQCDRLLKEARLMDRLLARAAIDSAEWRVLLALREADLGGGAASATSIALACGASATAGLRRIAALEGRGLVGRGDDSSDGRRAMLTLTATGRTLCGEVIEAIVAARAA